MGSHPSIGKDIRAPRNAFPKSTNLQRIDTGYDEKEFKQILRSVVQSLRESKQRFESEYQPKYLGKEPPLEGVATFSKTTGKYVLWATHEHRVWFFENKMQCKKLSYSEVNKIPQGHVFWYAINRDYIHDEYKSVEEFYKYIGAGPNYQAKYLGKESPVKYITPWKKWEYVVWYWENKMGARSYSEKEVKEKFPEFRIAMREHWSGVSKVMKKLNVWSYISAYNLAPYYLMLIIRTGLNPSTVQNLDIDCIQKDPIDENRKYIDWTKYRSHKKGMTIPEGKAKNDTWAVAIVERVVEITSKIRPEGMKSLWISNANNKKIPKTFSEKYFQAGVRRIFDNFPVFSSESNEEINVVAKNIRPTIAWSEYLRTEDLRYLQSLLGHANTSTTSEYLRRLDDPLFRTRRAIHGEALFIGLTSSAEHAKQYLAENEQKVLAKDQSNGLFDGLLNHCQDPTDSPVRGQSRGELCSAATDVCLGCQNLAITPEDIKKYFCYVNFYDYLLAIREISKDEYEAAVSEKKYIWMKYILPKYPDSLVNELREEAVESPIPIWDPRLYEDNRSE